jgi:hypothetical protein
MATIGKVRAVFTASTSGLTAGVSQATSSMKRMQAEVRGLRGSMASLVAIQGTQLFASFVSGATQAARSLISMGAAEAETIDNTNKLAARLGFTYAEMAGLANAGALVDVGMDTIAKATQKAEIAFAKAAGGSKAATAAFAAIGLSVDQLNGLTAAERFQAIAQAISQLPTEAQRAAAAVQIFGRSGVELLPMFQQGAAGIQAATAEAQRFGLALTQAQADNVDAMGDSFDRAKQAISGVIQQVVAYLAPAIESVTTQFSDLVGYVGGTTIGQTIGEGILQGARFFATIADAVIANLSTVWEYVSQVGGQWSSVFEVGSRVASFFSGVGNTLQAAFQVILVPLTGVVEGLVYAAQQIGGALGFDTSWADGALAAMKEFRDGAVVGVEKNMNQAAADFNAAIFGTDEASQAGQAIAGPLTTAVDSAIAAAQAAAVGVDQATATAIDRQGAQDPAAAAAVTPVKEALRAFDARSAEGVKEMFRLMRQQGPTEEQKQTNILQRIADNTEDIGGDDLDVADFAPAAGV